MRTSCMGTERIAAGPGVISVTIHPSISNMRREKLMTVIMKNPRHFNEITEHKCELVFFWIASQREPDDV